MVKARFRKILTITAAVLAAFIGFSFTLASGGAVYASAASAYSSALDDLQSDPNFNVADYPTGGEDYLIEIIQVAESIDGELFVYCYQPYGKLTASSVSISKTLGDDYAPRKYTLTFLNYNGVFYKYLVENFKLEIEAERYYNISQIWRKYDRQIDGDQSGDQTDKEIPYPVGIYWTAITDYSGAVSYKKQEVETVEIELPYHGSVRYPNGTTWTNRQACDGHFIAFNVGNYDVTRLMAADVTYRTQKYSKAALSSTKYEPVSEPQHITIRHDSDDDKVSNDVCGLFGKKYTWDTICKTSDFVNDVNLQDSEKKEELLQREWVVNFLTTDYVSPAGGDNVIATYFMFNPITAGAATLYNAIDLLFSETSGTLVSEVAVLRLEFEVDGKVYNLGTVTKVVTGPEQPIETKPDLFEEFIQKISEALASVPWWVWVLIIVGVVAVVVGVLSIFFPLVGKILYAIWRVITAPFRALAKAIKRGRQRRERRRAAAATSTKSGKRKGKKRKRKAKAKK